MTTVFKTTIPLEDLHKAIAEIFPNGLDVSLPVAHLIVLNMTAKLLEPKPDDANDTDDVAATDAVPFAEEHITTAARAIEDMAKFAPTTITDATSTLVKMTDLPIQVFTVGQDVEVSGDLFVGSGEVKYILPDADYTGADFKHLKRNQPFPQIGVRCDDGKLRHYNADDLAAGKVKPVDDMEDDVEENSEAEDDEF